MTSNKCQNIRRDLYCGFDDSNHAGNNPKGEIIVGVFSERAEDFNREKFHKRRDVEKALCFVSKKHRGYLFTQLPKEADYLKHFNLPLVAPLFIKEYLARNSYGIEPTSLTLGFDGPIEKKWKNILEKDLEMFPDVKIEYFTGKTKRVCPISVYAADTISNWLFGLTFKEIVTEHSEMFNIPLETLAERLDLFR